jgi:hypothetical protein
VLHTLLSSIDNKVCDTVLSAFAACQTLTHYETLAPPGAGRMGAVYQARDARLEREAKRSLLVGTELVEGRGVDPVDLGVGRRVPGTPADAGTEPRPSSMGSGPRRTRMR